MFRIGICDDDLQEAQKIEEYIRDMPFHDLETEVFLKTPRNGSGYGADIRNRS